MKKKILVMGIALIMLCMAAAVIFATNAKEGETWAIEYTIKWTDTYETVDQGLLYYTHQSSVSRNLEVYAMQQLGWRTYTRYVGTGQNRREQLLILNCLQIQ
ncbi:MAG: hypothetical protein LBQ89_09675 [Treponema sp.]|jgi:uncharacterized protein YxeA|nr:hypothetical protein [Treponema sp.]